MICLCLPQIQTTILNSFMNFHHISVALRQGHTLAVTRHSGGFVARLSNGLTSQSKRTLWDSLDELNIRSFEETACHSTLRAQGEEPSTPNSPNA